MGIDKIIMYIMVIFMIIGGIDKCLGNKFGYGEKFEEGIMAMGSLALAMVGIIALAPVLGEVLKPVVTPIYKMLGADPSMFATTLLATDMGGTPLAFKLTTDVQAAKFASFILGSMMGPTIVFTIPVALGIIEKEDRPFLAKGILAGMTTIPIGCFFGGIIAGMPVIMVLKNLIPIIIFSILICIGLWKIPEKMTKGFSIFGQAVVIIITLGLVVAIIQALTPITIIPGMDSIYTVYDQAAKELKMGGIETIGAIAIVLAGAFPLVHFITQVFKKPLTAIGKGLGMNESGAAGLVATLANNIPMFGILKDMDSNGKVMNIAFAVSGAFVFGDHLGFVAGYANGAYKDMMFPMIVGKLVAGITAIFVAKMLFCKKGKNA
ncbi:ethanolamine utilization protein EutH [Leptotrichia sp. oral taxon 221]|uniref:ethanolamine utilization protein EutH n=1 Tax=Leptotrichia sp. oral taxon 221 TaxID=712362 RepID=UPI001B8D8D34|nr:ethanolamine utilization protein EutH [Leptotrichia sp. oral taxon 221]QUB97315.1 ethanolamine utilization protein EutH [Leptotrichia sp. oral taxon 221]